MPLAITLLLLGNQHATFRVLLTKLIHAISHTRALYYINGTNGDIIWKLGGKNSSFTFGPNATFYGQQDARFVDGPTLISMHVGEATTGQTSAYRFPSDLLTRDTEHRRVAERGLTLSLNLTTMEATMATEFLPLTPYTSTSQGSLRVSRNNYLSHSTDSWYSIPV